MMIPRAPIGKPRFNKDRVSAVHTLILFLIALCLVYFIGSWSSAKSPLVSAVIAQEKPTATLLIPGRAASQEIAPGTSQTYEIGLKQGQYFRLSLQKRDLHLLITIQNPEGPGRRENS